MILHLKYLVGLGILLSALISSMSLHGEKKIVERSAKKMPEWVMHQSEDYLVAIGSGLTLKEAQNQVEQELLRQVLSAVAVNVEGETVSDSGVEGDKEWDDFHSRLSVRIAQLPFVSDISMAKCKDSYWEHSYDKDSSKDNYDIYVLYPFDSFTRRKLIKEYEIYDSKMESALQRLEEGWQEIEEFDKMIEAEGELEGLMTWFPDRQRRNRVKKTLELYRSIRSSLVLVGEVTAKGKCRVTVMRGGRPFKFPGRLNATSNCASHIAVNHDGDGWIVTFNTEDCLEWEDNKLMLSLRGEGLNLKAELAF